MVYRIRIELKHYIIRVHGKQIIIMIIIYGK